MPVEEMLIDLGFALDAFRNQPTHDTFAEVQFQLMRIRDVCEDELPED